MVQTSIPELMRIAAVVWNPQKKRVTIERHNLRDEPMLYVEKKPETTICRKKGQTDYLLPLWTVKSSKTGYPTNQQLSEWTGIDLTIIPVINK